MTLTVTHLSCLHEKMESELQPLEKDDQINQIQLMFELEKLIDDLVPVSDEGDLPVLNMPILDTPTEFDAGLSSNDHQNNKLKQCTECKKKFIHIQKHMLVHSKKKPFVCSKCSSSFSQKSNLNRHILSMHDETFVICHLCSKKFKRKDKLKKHSKICKGFIP